MTLSKTFPTIFKTEMFNKQGPNRRFLFAATAASRMTLEAEAASRSIGCQCQTALNRDFPKPFINKWLHLLHLQEEHQPNHCMKTTHFLPQAWHYISNIIFVL